MAIETILVLDNTKAIQRTGYTLNLSGTTKVYGDLISSTGYTATTDYHFINKKYLDDNRGNENGICLSSGGKLALGGSLTGNTNVNTAGYGISFACCSITQGNNSFAHGTSVNTYGSNSHAEGYITKAYSNNSHAEGKCSDSCGENSHVEGYSSLTYGSHSHAEGECNTTCGCSSHAEGKCTIAFGLVSHAEGYKTESVGNVSHAEGRNTIASGLYSHSQGYYTSACGKSSFSSGEGLSGKTLIASGTGSFIHSHNTSGQTSGHGALANYSAILGGRNHNIESGNTHAVIIGGDSIKLTGSTYNGYTAVGGLAIFDTPDNGGSNDILTWNSTTKKIGKISQASISGGSGANTVVFVNNKSDLPTSSGGVITITSGTSYIIVDEVDLTGDRIFINENGSIRGIDSNLSILKSTGLGMDYIITTNYGINIDRLTIESDYGIDISGNTSINDISLGLTSVNFLNSSNALKIGKINNFIGTNLGFLNSGGILLNDSVDTFGISESLFNTNSGNTMITVSSGATINRRFRIIYSSFVILTGETGINFSTGATVPVESYILDTVNFSGGGTYLAGIGVIENETLFTNNLGIKNTSVIANYYMSNNIVNTVITTQGVPVKVSGTTTASTITSKFIHTNNRVTYSGKIIRNFKATAVASLSTGNNVIVGLYIAKNGTIISDSEMYITADGSGNFENVSIQTLIELNENDYIEVWVENDTNTTDITVDYLNLIINEIN